MAAVVRGVGMSQVTMRYAGPSRVTLTAGAWLVFLAAALRQAREDAGVDPRQQGLFTGRLAEPATFRALMMGLRGVVDARFHRPDLWRYLDPVVTSGAETVRLESFSSCGSAYARVDLGGDAFEDARFGRAGTTNVDFTEPFVRGLTTLRPGEPAELELGEDSVALRGERAEVVERRVRLPERWRRGFLHVQAVQRRASPLVELSGAALRQLLRQTPKTRRGPLWLLPGPRPRVFETRPADAAAFEVVDAHRLWLLAPVLPMVRAVRVYRVEDTGASVWAVDAGAGAKSTLALSARAEHGFSGDGDALLHLRAPTEATEPRLAWLRDLVDHATVFHVDDLADTAGLSLPELRDLLDRLSVDGVLGYDRDGDCYFHRVLPFRARGAAPRSRLARTAALVDPPGRIEVERRDPREAGGIEGDGWVRGEHATYRVRLTVDAAGAMIDGRCTCQWFQKHRLTRGPCRHLLAFRFSVEGSASG